jgi:hypothetical protein
MQLEGYERGIHAVWADTSDAVVAEVLNASVRRCAAPTSRTAFVLTGMKTPFASNSPIMAVLACLKLILGLLDPVLGG